MEGDAVLLVDLAHEVADFPAEHVFHRPRFGCHDMYREPPLAQRRRDLEPDEARADDDRPARGRRRGDKCPAVGERSQMMDMRKIAAGNIEPDRRGAGGEEQRAVMMPAAVSEPDLASLG